ncbi:hypothetical protein Ahy_Scaffold8g108388 isoform B [Arachis hypogaea]|uniref:Transmembrane protein n=1 Tax=Arachis hypogaea TaxID=3818 RepID=A0A444WND1_ARAHY|nr:hypothetical protein Ahy_Scaffold8g108388 isoform B [Arachis hypogaea]
MLKSCLCYPYYNNLSNFQIKQKYVNIFKILLTKIQSTKEYLKTKIYLRQCFCKYKHMVFFIYQTQNEEFELLKSTSTSSKKTTRNFSVVLIVSILILKYREKPTQAEHIGTNCSGRRDHDGGVVKLQVEEEKAAECGKKKILSFTGFGSGIKITFFIFTNIKVFVIIKYLINIVINQKHFKFPKSISIPPPFCKRWTPPPSKTKTISNFFFSNFSHPGNKKEKGFASFLHFQLSITLQKSAKIQKQSTSQ